MSTWKEKFYNLFMPNNESRRDRIEEIYRLKYNNIPTKLYKYYSVSEYSLNNLENDVIWMSYPSSFNDPYDSSLLIDPYDLMSRVFLKNKKKIIEIIKRTWPDKIFNEIPKDYFEALKVLFPGGQREIEVVKDIILGYINEEMTKDMERFSETLGKSLSICCFSENNKSILMWSHYAKNHEGFCLEYNFSELPYDDIRNRMLYPVFYSNKRYDVTGLFVKMQDDKQNVDVAMALKASLHKSDDWIYEGEWRMVCPGGILKETEYKVPCPKAVYLGSKISKENKEIITKICIKKGIPVYEMMLSRTNLYEMEF